MKRLSRRGAILLPQPTVGAIMWPLSYCTLKKYSHAVAFSHSANDFYLKLELLLLKTASDQYCFGFFFFLPLLLMFFKTYKTTLAFSGSRISSPCQQALGRRSRQDNHLLRSEHTVSAVSLCLVSLAVQIFCLGPSNSSSLFQLLTDH